MLVKLQAEIDSEAGIEATRFVSLTAGCMNVA